ncbi:MULTISPECIES: hypothetical protein [unclassified Roseovarius]|jgi:uncharacterized protein YjiS (DUF1127 family)|uniref:hypothetical protein n=1 Tax=unclassified Roseovarius TaxID=2614913 RepID=UPI000068674E|nr:MULTISPECIES: hypothetical protein [unclassified Roseovarius]EAQ23542.1 hypothetical protein ROS217_17010 [Roseovarius sp. 217]KJS44764.1 MAG: hypothetical protein VR71_04530 [Roseovarius sp. BRH_c41]
MANITTNVSASPLREVWKRFTAALIRGLEAHAAVTSRRNRIEALEAKSDAELARMGLRREDIAYHVFKDLFYA